MYDEEKEIGGIDDLELFEEKLGDEEETETDSEEEEEAEVGETY